MKINRFQHWYNRSRRVEHALQGLPFLIVGGRTRAARRMAGKLVVHSLRLSFPTLPKNWNGVTITHLSDLHLGPFFTVQKHLPPVLDICRHLASDLICVTGDWVDWELAPLHQAIEGFRSIRPPLGWYGVLGNHDFLENRWQTIRALRGWLGKNLLINQTLRLMRGNEPLDICGLDYATDGNRGQRHHRNLRVHWPQTGEFSIGLSHHPNGFDPLREHGVKLVLSGHTHGGQISLTAAPQRVIGPAMHRFRYIRGLYEQGNAKLYVSCGLGQSIPLRVNCPPEIAQITLVRG